MGRPNPSREAKCSGANGDREMPIFPVQLTTSRVGNLTRLVLTLALLYVMTIQHTQHRHIFRRVHLPASSIELPLVNHRTIFSTDSMGRLCGQILLTDSNSFVAQLDEATPANTPLPGHPRRRTSTHSEKTFARSTGRDVVARSAGR